MRKKLKSKLMHGQVFLSMIGYSWLMLLLLGSCGRQESSHEHSDTYTCPMHPTVVSDKPGVCPVCGMDLVRKARPGEELKITPDLARVIKSTNEVVLTSINTTKAVYQTMTLSLPLQGVVTYDARNLNIIAARVGGRLEKVFLKYNYQAVRKGQKVAEIYSTELVNAQRELIYLVRNDPSNQPLLEAAQRKLSLLGATENQIEELKKTLEVKYTFSIYSPYDGYVISENLAIPSAPIRISNNPTMNSGGMGMGNTNARVEPDGFRSGGVSSILREGNYVTAGQTLFSIVNINSLWIEFNIPISNAFSINVGDDLEWIYSGGSKQIKVDFIEPFFADGEDFIKVRSYYKGGDVSIGQWVEASVKSISAESLWIPKQALLNLGLDQIVFVRERGLFKPRKVKAGLMNNEWVEIKNGLTSSDEIAINAQYMVDSENFIKTAN